MAKKIGFAFLLTLTLFLFNDLSNQNKSDRSPHLVSVPGQTTGMPQAVSPIARLESTASSKDLSFSDLPKDLQKVARQSISKEQSLAYHIASQDDQILAVNPAQNFEATFNQQGMRLKSQDPSRRYQLDLSLKAMGWQHRLQPIPEGEVFYNKNRLEIKRPQVTEWYINKERGLEQGFTIDQAPEGDGDRLVLEIGVESNLSASVMKSEKDIFLKAKCGHHLRYAGLVVNDATGKELPAALSLAGDDWQISVETEGAEFPIVVDPTIFEDDIIYASDGQAGDNFGWAIALDGDKVLISARSAEAAYIFSFDGLTWQEDAKLQPVNPADGYGFSIALHGDTALVGAPNHNNDTGMVYVFFFNGSSWEEQAQLFASDGVADDDFGRQVAVYENTALISACGRNAQRGAVYAFTRQGNQWSEQSFFTPNDDDSRGFGSTLDLDQDTIVISTKKTDDSSNPIKSAYIFVGSGGSWSQQARLTLDSGGDQDHFGHDLAIDGDLALVASLGDDDLGPDAGAVVAYQRNGSSWAQIQKFYSGDNNSYNFGGRIGMHGNTAIISRAGGQEIFTFDGLAWSKQADAMTSTSSNPGTANDIDHDKILIGLTGLNGTGGVHVYNTAGSTITYPSIFNNLFTIDILGLGDPCLTPGEIHQDKDVAAKISLDGNANILLHSGQEILDQTDLVIPGRDEATTFKVQRRHMTRIEPEHSIFGPAWAFNYRHAFKEQVDGSLSMECFGRIDTFRSTGSNVWEGGAGRFDRLVFDGVDTSTLRMSDGRELTFHTELDGNQLLRGHLSQIISPNIGNTLTFSYETSAQEPDLLKRKLLSVTDSFGRLINFQYGGDSDYPDGVSKIIDFSNREVLYDYNSSGQLISVTTPTIQSTNGLNDFPGGKTTQYNYLNHPTASLQNAIASVIYPNQVASGGLETRLSWTYETDQQDPAYAHVLTHTVGNTSASSDLEAGGTYSYDYQINSQIHNANSAAITTTVHDRRNTQTEVDLNFMGHMLSEKIFTQGFRSGEPNHRQRSFKYNRDGDLLQSTDVLGMVSDHQIADPADVPRTSGANKVAHHDLADSRGADQDFIRSEIVYEPIFNKAFKRIDPRGFENGNTPEQFTTIYFFDYMEDLNAAKAYFAPKLGLSEAELQQLFDDAGITALAGSIQDVNGDGVTNQICGNVINIRYPEVTLPPQATLAGLGSTQNAEEFFVFNSFGQITEHQDREQNTHTYEYFGAADPAGLSSGIDPAGGGFLARETKDSSSDPGRNSGHDPLPVQQVTEYEYKSQGGGAFPANERSTPTAVIDPRGIKHLYLINELDQVVIEQKADENTGSVEPGLPTFSYQNINLYDHNNNLIETRTQNRDTLDQDNDFIVNQYSYDILDQLRSEILDVNNLHIENSYEYDPSQNLVKKTRGDGSPEAATEEWLYDERNILVSHTQGVGTPDQSTTTTKIDGNGNITHWIDADGGNISEVIYDGFDRPLTLVDRVSNVENFTYDSAGNILTVNKLEPGTSSGGGPIIPIPVQSLLETTAYQYDERNRLFREDREIFHYSGQNIGQIDDGALDPGDNLVSTVLIKDRLDRVIGTVDADNEFNESRFDGLSRVLRAIDAANNESRFTYDQNSNLTEREDIEKSAGLIAGDEIFITQFTYDALNRQDSITEPNAQITDYEYDSRNNLIKTIDELGNEIEKRYDRLNRLIDTRTYLSASGTSASASNFDSNQGGGDGRITILQSWDNLHRLKTQTDDNGNATTYTYDTLNRKTQCDYADGTQESWTYNADNELLTHTNQNGSVETWTHDEDGRPTKVEIDNSQATTTVLGTTEKDWDYDGLDRITLASDNNDPNDGNDDITCRYFYDSLSRVIRESQQVGNGAAELVDTEWQGSIRKVSTKYPGGRKIKGIYDELHRLDEITKGNGNLIARYEYVGPTRLARLTYGNDSVLDKRNDAGTQTNSGSGAGYDDNRRHITHRWKDSSGQVLTSYINSYNGTNRRLTELREHFSNSQDVYTFDSAYRMLSFDRDSSSTFSDRALDGADKMIAFNDEGANPMPVVDGDAGEAGMNQYSSFNGAGITNRNYDDNGALRDDGTTNKYLFDYSNRIVEVRDQFDALVETYTYSSDNRRVLSTNASTGVQTRYIYDGWNVLQEQEDNVIAREYVLGPGLDNLVQVKDYTQMFDPEYYYHCNSQGFVGAITDNNENIVEYYTYSWLGRPSIFDSAQQSISSSTIGNPYMFQGRRYDSETELYYYRNRFYSADTGEFLSLDPQGIWYDEFQRGNGYGAFGGDGLNNFDPMGLEMYSDPRFTEGIAQADATHLAATVADPNTDPETTQAVLMNLSYGSPGGALDAVEGGMVSTYLGFEAVTMLGLGGAAVARTAGVAAGKKVVCETAGETAQEALARLFKNPELLKNMSDAQLKALAEAAGWKVGKLKKGSAKGKGLRIQDPDNHSRVIQRHPGGGTHGPSPYDKVSSPEGGVQRIPHDSSNFIENPHLGR